MKKNPILAWLKPEPGLQNRAPVQKMIWNLYFLFNHRFRHPKYTPKNQSEGVYRDKKNYQTFSFMSWVVIRHLSSFLTWFKTLTLL